MCWRLTGLNDDSGILVLHGVVGFQEDFAVQACHHFLLVFPKSLLLSACSEAVSSMTSTSFYLGMPACVGILCMNSCMPLCCFLTPSVGVPCFFTHGLVQEVPFFFFKTAATHRACFSTEQWEASPQAGSATACALRDAIFVSGARLSSTSNAACVLASFRRK